MDLLTALLIVAVLAAAALAAGHMVARQTWPRRRRRWQERAAEAEREAQQIDTGSEFGQEPHQGERAGEIYQLQAEELQTRARRERLEAELMEDEARRLRKTVNDDEQRP